MAIIGVISDTHGLMRPQVATVLANVAHIIHAGDIGGPQVITSLRRLAPVTAVRGNVDTGEWAAAYPCCARIRLAGRQFYLLHDLKQLDLNPVTEGVDVVVSGHSHRPKAERRGGVLYVKPGSAGPRRFHLPITLATLEITEDGVWPLFHELPP